MRELINISVIIPTLNAGPGLEELLCKLREQNCGLQEIIVVDSGSTDQTLSTAETFRAKILKVPPGHFDHGATRNYAAGSAGGNILLFMTQDAFPAGPETIGNLIKPLVHRDIAVSYARQVAAPGAPLSEQYLRLANYPPAARVNSKETVQRLGIRAFQNSNVCAAYKREIFEELGGFCEPCVCNEDMLFAARALFNGYRVAYSADAVVRHTHRYSTGQLFKRYFDIGASLEHQPAIRRAAKTEAKGAEFFSGYLAFLKQNGRLYYLPAALLESASRYAGFKAGTYNRYIPRGFRKRLGMNSIYWRNLSGKEAETGPKAGCKDQPNALK